MTTANLPDADVLAVLQGPLDDARRALDVLYARIQKHRQDVELPVFACWTEAVAGAINELGAMTCAATICDYRIVATVDHLDALCAVCATKENL